MSKLSWHGKTPNNLQSKVTTEVWLVVIEPFKNIASLDIMSPKHWVKVKSLQMHGNHVAQGSVFKIDDGQSSS